MAQAKRATFSGCWSFCNFRCTKAHDRRAGLGVGLEWGRTLLVRYLTARISRSRYVRFVMGRFKIGTWVTITGREIDYNIAVRHAKHYYCTAHRFMSDRFETDLLRLISIRTRRRRITVHSVELADERSINDKMSVIWTRFRSVCNTHHTWLQLTRGPTAYTDVWNRSVRKYNAFNCTLVRGWWNICIMQRDGMVGRWPESRSINYHFVITAIAV